MKEEEEGGATNFLGELLDAQLQLLHLLPLTIPSVARVNAISIPTEHQAHYANYAR
jgi:hypothetical protein